MTWHDGRCLHGRSATLAAVTDGDMLPSGRPHRCRRQPAGKLQSASAANVSKAPYSRVPWLFARRRAGRSSDLATAHTAADKRSKLFVARR